MSEFNRMTVVAAAQIIEKMHTQAEFTSLATEWGVAPRCGSGSVLAKVNVMAQIAIDERPSVQTISGLMELPRAMVELAITAAPNTRNSPEWVKLKAGLRFDGFELLEVQVPSEKQSRWAEPAFEIRHELRRMLPQDVPETDFREAASEVEMLLDELRFPIAKGHMSRALSAFQRGEWSSANGELRNFYENYLNEIANALGYAGKDDSKLRRDFLGAGVEPPFLLADYNEWNANNQKPQYVQGLMSRMHPHGGHPGLSEEEDATFRLQVSLITARLLLRRFKKRKTI